MSNIMTVTFESELQIIAIKKMLEAIYESPIRPRGRHSDRISKINLRNHVKTVHEGIKYYCDLCDFRSARVSRLNKHIKIVIFFIIFV